MEQIVEKIKNYTYSVKEKKVGNIVKKISGEGSITINDAVGVKVSDITVYGKSEQDGTPTPEAPVEIKTVKGIENLFELGKETTQIISLNVDFNYNEVTINGTTSSAGDVFLKRDEIDKSGCRLIGNFKAGQYIFSSVLTSGNFEIPTGGAFAIYLKKADGTSIFSFGNSLITGIKKEFTLSEDTVLYLQMYVNTAGAIFNNVNIRTQIVESSKEYPFVPYGSNYLINKIIGKNKCNGINQKYYINTSATQCGVTSEDSGLIVPTDNADYMTISSKITQTRFRVGCLNEVVTDNKPHDIYSGINRDGKTNATVTCTGYKYIVVNATDLTQIQIEKGEVATEYEPYKENITTYDLKGNELVSIGDIKDELDEATGVLTKRIGKVILNGSESWSSASSVASGTSRFSFAFNGVINSGVAGDTKIYTISDKFVGTPWRNMYSIDTTSQNLISNYTDNTAKYNKRLHIRISNTIASDVDTFKTWLSENPVTVYYVLATPETIQLEPTNIELFNGVNNASIENELSPNIEVSYYSKEILDISDFKYEIKEL